jgi:broad specificity phosphatase PhoE
MAERVLYLVRHGQAEGHDDGSRLTDQGREQAALTAARVVGAGVAAVHHGPLPRAAETARVIADAIGVSTVADELVGDYIPFDPVGVDGLPDRFAQFAAGLTAAERDLGPQRAEQAFERFAVAPVADVSELVVSHNFTIGGFVCHALGAPMWRWMTLNQANCGITIIRYRTGVPPALECFNDTGHL